MRQLSLPEEIGMLNGRMPALHAATADLIERGALREGHDGSLTLDGHRTVGITPLQHAICAAIYNRSLPIERDARVQEELASLQRRVAEAGYLTTRRSRAAAVLPLLTLLPFFAVVALSIFDYRRPGGFGFPFFIFLPLFFVGTTLSFVAALRGRKKGGRTPQGVQELQRLRALPQQPGLGQSVALFGTRPMFVAFPAVAGLGWMMTDIPDPVQETQRQLAGSSSSYSCSSSDSNTNWCGGGSSCGSGGCGSSCSSGGCSSGSCGSSCSSSSCGSSCGS